MEEGTRMNMSILLQFAKFSKGFRISDFDEFVQESIGVNNLDFFGRLAYPNQWQIRLTDPEIRERLIRLGRTRIKNRSCWMYPLNPQEIRGFVHWLPNSVTNDQLTEHFKLYGEVLFVESQERNVEGRRIESDPRYYGLLLPHGTIKEDLPHFLKINGFLCLVVIRGRKPACFHCKEVGHRRVECPKYKAKLSGYCSRDKNSALKRLKPRGRRHIEVDTAMRGETGSNDVTSTDDTLSLERQDSINEETIELLPELEDHEVITEEATSSTEKGLLESSVALEDKAESYLVSSTATPSVLKTQTQDFLKVMREIQRKTSEDLQQRLKSFENEIAGTFTRGVLFNDTEEETSTEIKPYEKDFDNDTNVKETKGDEISMRCKDIFETFDHIYKYSREMAKSVEKNKSTAVDSVSVSDSRSAILMLEETKQSAIEIVEGTFTKLTEFTKSNEAAEPLPEDSAADTDQKLIEDKMHSHLLMLKHAKQTAKEYFGNTFKKLEEEISSLSSELDDEQTDRDTRLTKDDIQFAYQMLEQTRKTVEETLESTFGRLESEVTKVTETDEMITEISPKNIPLLKVSEDSKNSAEVLELKGVIDTIEYCSKEEMETVVGDEHSEMQSCIGKIQEETIQIECETSAESLEIFKASEISKQSEQVSTDTEKTVTTNKELELKLKVTEVAQEGIYKLQTNIKTIFDLVLAEGKSELLSETGTVMKQVESKVNRMGEEMKSRVKRDIEYVFASFKVD